MERWEPTSKKWKNFLISGWGWDIIFNVRNIRNRLEKYLISFRTHNEFHEQCVERIYCDLMQQLNLEELEVYARYTRRGGLDINPYRSTNQDETPFQVKINRQ